MNLKRIVRRKQVLIVAHDAGGAEVVSSWVRRHAHYNYIFVLEGPAIRIFHNKLGKIRISSRKILWKSLTESDFVVTGTSWASDLEKKAIYLAKKNKTKIYSFLDHWIDFPARFQYGGKRILPDKIWVGDREALKIAGRHFPKRVLRLKRNPYFSDIKEEMSSYRPIKRGNRGLNILYICEPISEQSLKQYGYPDHWGYTEYEAVEKFLLTISKGKAPSEIAEIRLRLHPAEKKTKYRRVIKPFCDLPITFGSKKTLVEDCLWADWVVGCESTAMIIGLLAGRKVFCTIPRAGLPCSLPQKKIRRFFT